MPTLRQLSSVVLLIANGGLPSLAGSASPPNIVFILADDLGWSDLGCQGSGYYETPHIDRLAQGGMRFINGYSAGPNCQPTRAALLTGQYGPRTGVYTVGNIDRFPWRSRPLRPVTNVDALPLDRATIADALRAAGYATAMFGKWHLGDQGPHHPLARGFDEALVRRGAHFDFTTRPPSAIPPGAYLADFLTDRAIDFIRRHRDRPFFVYLPHYAVHAPHQAKSPHIERFRGKSPVGSHRDPTYAAMIASVDESVGRIAAVLDELDLRRRTLLVFSSDNGGVGGYEREGIPNPGITGNEPLRGGKGMLYEGGIRVPYIFSWPGAIDALGTCEVPIHSVDLLPTLLELAGAETPGQPLDGTSYLGLLKGDAPEAGERPPLYWHFPGYLGAPRNTWRTTPVGAIRLGDWKLLEFFEDDRLELYHLPDDPGERQNLVQQHPDRVRELHGALVRWRKAIGAPMPESNDPSAAEPARRKRAKARD